MARTKIDDIFVQALGARREFLYTQIKEIEARPRILEELQQELAELEAKLKEIDPTIPSKDEEAQAAEVAELADAELKGG